jgi:hypothetical protein
LPASAERAFLLTDALAMQQAAASSRPEIGAGNQYERDTLQHERRRVT